MYIQRSQWTNRVGKTYESIWLRESYREGGKVKTRSIANLKKWTPEAVQALEYALKNKKAPNMESEETRSITQGNSFGAVYVVAQTGKRLGIEKALGNTQEGKMANWQILARVLEQGSRLSAVRMAQLHAIQELVSFEKSFSENDLYDNLHWMARHQKGIETKLFRMAYQGKETPKLFLYDVTSSYVEGEENELARYGYNRDKKQGKKQIVVGVLTDDQGIALSAEVFEGNVSDPKTVTHQINTLGKRFGCEKVIFVGDRGMLKHQNLEELKEREFSYITGITRPQIRKLIQEGALQLGLFDETLKEETIEGIRYLYRRNPIRAKELERKRQEKEKRVETEVEKQNERLRDHPRSQTETAVRNVESWIQKLRMESWISVKSEGRTLRLERNEEALTTLAELDGCYVLKSDVSAEELSKEVLHARYKSLAQVEKAFRTGKSELDLRPIHVRTEESTRGHVLVILLAYRIWQELEKRWRSIPVTVREGLEHLKGLSTYRVTLPGGKEILAVPEPNPICRQLLEALDIRLPKTVEKSAVVVRTYKPLKRKT